MQRIYLAVGSRLAAVIVTRDAADITLTGLAVTLGAPVELFEVGLAHPQTPPGPLLCGDAAEVTRLRPLGRHVEPSPALPLGS